MIKKALPFVVVLIFISSGTLFGQWKSDSTSNTPVCTATGSQQNPQACSDGANGIIIVWEDFRSGTNWDVYAQRLDANGVPQWTSNGVNLCTSSANQTSPVICSDGSGGAYVIWKDTRTAANGTDLYGQHISSSGSLQFGATGYGVAVSGDASPPTNLTITDDGYGGAYVAWEDYRTSIASSSRPDIWMNRLSGGGVSWGAGGRSVAAQTLRQTAPKLVADGSGGCYLAWVNGTLPASIWAARVDGNGNTSWSNQIFEGATGSSDASSNPSISRDGSQLCISWEQLNSSAASKGLNVLANRVTSSGMIVWGTSTVGSEISTDWAGDQINPIVFSDDSAGAGPNAGLLVIYQDYSSGSSDIVMTRLLPDGITLRPAFSGQLYSVCRQNNEQTFPTAVKTGSGELLIVWNDARSNGSSSTYSSIYAQRVNSVPKRLLGTANSTWGIPISNRVNSNADQVVLIPRTNGGIAAWHDNRNGNTDIYAQLIFKDGSLPVELSAFSAVATKSGDVLLNWQTASEKNNAGFEVERRLISDPNASNTFEVVGSYLNTTSLSGAGSSNVTRSYDFIDRPGKPGIYEYRLSDFSLDGEKTTHDPKTVEVTSAIAGNNFSVGQTVPNPFNDRTNIQIFLPQQAQVELTLSDALGRQVASSAGTMFESGNHELAVNSGLFGKEIPSGAYYYSVTFRDPQSGSILWKMSKAQLMIKITN